MHLSTEKLVLSGQAPYLTNAYHLARVARAVYSPEPEKDFPFLEVMDRAISIRRERICGLVTGNQQHVVIAFRGRDENQQLIESLAYGQTEWIHGRAHGGFVRLLDSVWKEILAGLFDTGAHTKSIWLTGHSMGGSLAILAAQRLEHEGFDPHLVATFGAPQVLDKTAAAAFTVPVYRFINNEDLVPSVPWPTLFDTYAHVGEEVFILPSGEIAHKRHDHHLARKIDRANTIGEGIIPAGPVHDHIMNHYLAKLARHA